MRTRSRSRGRSPARGGKTSAHSNSNGSSAPSKSGNPPPGYQLMFALKYYRTQPQISSTVLTSFVWCMCLVGFEYILRWLFKLNLVQNLSPILQNERNTQIIARHIGTDFAAAVMCSYLGLTVKNGGLGPIWESLKSPRSEKLYKKARKGYAKRLWTYNAEGFRIFVFFFAYQFKNLWDAYVWNDGPEFIMVS